MSRRVLCLSILLGLVWLEGRAEPPILDLAVQSPTHSVISEFDANSRQLVYLAKSGAKFLLGLDDRGRITSIQLDDKTWSFSYSITGHVEQVSYSNGKQTRTINAAIKDKQRFVEPFRYSSSVMLLEQPQALFDDVAKRMSQWLMWQSNKLWQSQLNRLWQLSVAHTGKAIGPERASLDELRKPKTEVGAGFPPSLNPLHDALGRVESVEFNAAIIAFGYDDTTGGSAGLGRLTQINNDYAKTHYRYNRLGQISSTISEFGGKSYTISYQYDGFDQLQKVSYPNGNVVDYQRDGAGNIMSVELYQQGVRIPLAQNIIWGESRIVSFDWGNGLSYSAEDIAKTVGKWQDGPVVWRYQNSIENGHSVFRVSSNDEPGLIESESIERDLYELEWIRKADRETLDNVVDFYRLSFDMQSRRTALVDSEQNVRYDYQEPGFLLKQLHPSAHWGLEYGKDGELTHFGQLSFSYDYAGNIKSIKRNGRSISTYRYNVQGQPILNITPDKTVHFVYDLAGNLVAHYDFVEGAVTNYIYLGERVLASAVASTLVRDSEQEPIKPLPELSVQQENVVKSDKDGDQPALTSEQQDALDDRRWDKELALEQAQSLNNGRPEGLKPKTVIPEEHPKAVIEAGPDTDSGLEPEPTIISNEEVEPDPMEGQDGDGGLLVEEVRASLPPLPRPNPFPSGRGDSIDSRNEIAKQRDDLVEVTKDPLTAAGRELSQENIERVERLQRQKADAKGIANPQSVVKKAASLTYRQLYFHHRDPFGNVLVLTNEQQQPVWQANYSLDGLAIIDEAEVTNLVRFQQYFWNQEAKLYITPLGLYSPLVGVHFQPK
ncbi:MAG: hypothetical protein CMF25_00730 [Kangiellaceae bacterium]|nr:hypothetical protein [Kangiellaceae bacterium]